MTTADQALVLGGGGVPGIAWMTGLLAGLADAGQDVTGADLMIGTSAGAAVAAQMGSGLPLAQLYARQADPEFQADEIPVGIDPESSSTQWRELIDRADTPEEKLRALGKFAVAARTVPEACRRAVIASRLPSHEWPSRPIMITALDCETGAMEVFTAASGTSLIDAVAASCAVPGIWPAVTIGGRRFMDGGTRSSHNADLAAGAARVLVISAIGSGAQAQSPLSLAETVARLRADGSQVAVIEPDGPSRAAMGANPLDLDTRVPAAVAGRAQGRQGLA